MLSGSFAVHARARYGGGGGGGGFGGFGGGGFGGLGGNMGATRSLYGRRGGDLIILNPWAVFGYCGDDATRSRGHHLAPYLDGATSYQQP
jgi:hypothetical protein